MQVRLKPKTYGPLVLGSADADTLEFVTEAGNRLKGGRTSQSDALAPPDLMLAALGTCIAISMRMAAEQMALSLGRLELSAVAIKATDLPNRFGRFEVDVSTEMAVAPERVDELLQKTKNLCTVSNTLGAPVDIRLATLAA